MVFYRIESRCGDLETTQQVGHRAWTRPVSSNLNPILFLLFQLLTLFSFHPELGRAIRILWWVMPEVTCLISFRTWVSGKWSEWNISRDIYQADSGNPTPWGSIRAAEEMFLLESHTQEEPVLRWVYLVQRETGLAFCRDTMHTHMHTHTRGHTHVNTHTDT